MATSSSWLGVGTAVLVDLAQPLVSGMAGSKVHGRAEVWAENPFPDDFVDGCRISVTHMNLAVHVGTHVDAPRHFFADGKTIDQFPLERFVRPAVTIHMPLEGAVAVTASDLEAVLPDVSRGDFLLLSFGYADRFGEPVYYEHPYLTRDAAELLLALGVSGLGTDTMTPDKPAEYREEGCDFPVHRALLGEDVLIFENLGPGLAEIAGRRVLVSAVPLPLAGDGSLVAPYAVVPGGADVPVAQDPG